MRMLFLESHPMWIFGLPNGFRDIGCEVMVSGPLTEENIPKMMSSFKPHLIITMGWTSENVRQKVDWIRRNVKLYRIPHVYWATEDPTHTFTFTLPLIKRMQPDFVFTICKARIDYYRKLGIKCAHMDFGFHRSKNHHTPPVDKYKCQIAVIANGYPNILKLYPNHYRIQSLNDLISPLVKEDIRIDFWGREWNNMSSIIGEHIPDEWIHGYLPYEESCTVYSSADIVIGLQNHLTQLTQRTYEILGSGGFLLTSDTPEIRRIFVPDRDLVVSSSPEETLKQVEYYLNNKEARENIRNQGKIAAIPHSYSYRARCILKVLGAENILSNI